MTEVLGNVRLEEKKKSHMVGIAMGTRSAELLLSCSALVWCGNLFFWICVLFCLHMSVDGSRR